MRIHFAKAFAVDLFHDYYPSGVSEDFSVEPTLATRQELNKHGLLFKTTPQGFVVLCETEGDGSTPIRPLVPPLSFSFVLRSINPFLFNAANLPFTKSPQQLFYLGTRQKDSNAGELLLSADPIGKFVGAADLLALRPQRFQASFPAAGAAARWQLFDGRGGLLRSWAVPALGATSTGLVEVPQAGSYRLLGDGVDRLVFYADDQLAGGTPFGVIEIAADALVTAPFRFVSDAGAVAFKRYAVRLQARRTTWQYYVVPKFDTDVDPQDLSISLASPAVSFTRKSAVTLADGRTAIPFEAASELPLSQTSIKGVQLKKNGPPTSRLTIDNLPNPSVNEVIPAAAGKVFSRVFVYV